MGPLDSAAPFTSVEQMDADVARTLQEFCRTNDIRRLEAEEILELLVDGEEPEWIAAQAAEDRPASAGPLAALLEQLAPQVRAARDGEEESESEAPGIDIEQGLAALGQALPPGVDPGQLQEILGSPRGRLLADLGLFCQERGYDSPGEEELHRIHEEWLQTPREGFEGRRPAEMLEGGGLLPERVVTFRRQQPKVGRNAPCPCGSGRKHKRCCGRGG